MREAQFVYRENRLIGYWTKVRRWAEVITQFALALSTTLIMAANRRRLVRPSANVL
jgi:hypothetical protein